MARLILLNGPPGSGKSTLAARYAADRPLTLAQWYPLYAACCDLGITLQVQVGNTGPPSYPSETGR